MCAVGSPDGQGKSFPIVEAIVDGTVPSVPWIMVLHRPQLTIVIHGTDKISILMPRISSLAVSSGSYYEPTNVMHLVKAHSSAILCARSSMATDSLVRKILEKIIRLACFLRQIR